MFLSLRPKSCEALKYIWTNKAWFKRPTPLRDTTGPSARKPPAVVVLDLGRLVALVSLQVLLRVLCAFGRQRARRSAVERVTKCCAVSWVYNPSALLVNHHGYGLSGSLHPSSSLLPPSNSSTIGPDVSPIPGNLRRTHRFAALSSTSGTKLRGRPGPGAQKMHPSIFRLLTTHEPLQQIFRKKSK